MVLPGTDRLSRDVPPRCEKAGSLYWLGTRDATGAFLDGGKTYKLTVPMPVPERLFWSVTSTIAQSQRNSDRPGQSGVAFAVRVEGQAPVIRGLVLRPDGAGRPRGRMDQDHPRQRVVRLLPHLRPRDARLRRHLEAGGLRVGEMSAFPLSRTMHLIGLRHAGIIFGKQTRF